MVRDKFDVSMAIHISNPELEAKLAAQRRNSTIASLVVGLLIMLLLALIFYLVGISIFSEKAEPMVAFTEEGIEEEEVEQEKIKPEVMKKPAAASSNMSAVVTAHVASEFSLPNPDIAVDNLAVDFGESEGFGAGWGGGSGDGFGSGGAGAFSFMGSKMSGERICFVMDYSNSMKGGGKIELLKAELAKTLKGLPDGVQFQMIFFAGPAWTPGSSLKKGGSKVTVTLNGRDY